jgi:demethylmenaquinone methyltransferase / 2-methoxy-6-polyprenyl-1,4-benzoquinol methylase
MGPKRLLLGIRWQGDWMNERQPNEPPAALAPHRHLSEFYPAPAGRQNFVNDLFDRAARDYDWVSGAMSFWRDQSYRRDALRRAGLQAGMRLLDVASGTGLMIKAALEIGLDAAQVTGVDPSRGMLAQNRERNPVTLLEGRGEALPCADESFDFVCMGYALRHLEDLRKLFGEFHRVLRPNGRVLILEITPPTSRLEFQLMRFYMKTIVPCLGWLRRRNKSTAKLMRYYWATITECVPPTIILSALEASRFKNVKHTTVGGVLSEYVGQR